MAFQTSTSIASAQLLVNAIATFAAANGWTVERNTLTGAARTVTLRKPGVSDYVHIFNLTADSVYMRASVGYDGALVPSLQPNVSATDAVSNSLTGPYPNVWFFANGDEINIVVRRADTTGAYSHMSFGVLKKYGSFTGGTFIDGSYFVAGGNSSGTWGGGSNHHGMFGYGTGNAGYVRIDADALTNRWARLSNGDIAFSGVAPLGATNTYSGNQAGPTFDIARYINAADDNIFSGRSFLHVIEISLRRVGTPNYISPVGYIDNTRYVSLQKFSPEQEITIASDTWMVFPVVRKADMSSVTNAPNASENNGFAIRKVV